MKKICSHLRTAMLVTAGFSFLFTVACDPEEKGKGQDQEPQTYTVTVIEGVNGTVEATPLEAEAGETIALTATPDQDYEFSLWDNHDGLTLENLDVDADGVATATFQMPAENVTIGADFTAIPPPLGGNVAPYILYVDTDGTLVAGAWGNKLSLANILYFKFGSVIGLVGGAKGHAYTSADIAFNPTNLPSTWSYATIPGYTGTSADLVGTTDYYASDTYNTFANLQAGKGDPCRLVGKTAAEIKEMTEQEFLAYNSGFRMMSTADAATLAGTTGNDTGRTDHIFVSPAPTAITGAVLPHSGSEPYNVSKFFPVAGYYGTGGSFNYVDLPGVTWRSGRYWLSSAVAGATQYGYSMVFGGDDEDNVMGLNPRKTNNPIQSFPVRCVD